MAEIIGLDRKRVAPGPEEPVPDVVDQLCDLLIRAQKGEIRAIGFAIVQRDNVVSTAYATGSDATDHELMAAITYLQFRFAAKKDCGCVPREG